MPGKLTPSKEGSAAFRCQHLLYMWVPYRQGCAQRSKGKSTHAQKRKWAYGQPPKQAPSLLLQTVGSGAKNGKGIPAAVMPKQIKIEKQAARKIKAQAQTNLFKPKSENLLLLLRCVAHKWQPRSAPKKLTHGAQTQSYKQMHITVV